MREASGCYTIREPRRAVFFHVLVEHGEEIRRHLGRNISDTGIFIESDPPYPLGTKVRIVFIYPGTEVELTAIGEVRHQSERPTLGIDGIETVIGCGIVFLRFEDGDIKPVIPPLAS